MDDLILTRILFWGDFDKHPDLAEVILIGLGHEELLFFKVG